MRYFKNSDSGHPWQWDGRSLWTLSVYGSVEELMGKNPRVIETDAAGNPLGKYRYFRDTASPAGEWRTNGTTWELRVGPDDDWGRSTCSAVEEFMSEPTAYECDEAGNRLAGKAVCSNLVFSDPSAKYGTMTIHGTIGVYEVSAGSSIGDVAADALRIRAFSSLTRIFFEFNGYILAAEETDTEASICDRYHRLRRTPPKEYTVPEPSLAPMFAGQAMAALMLNEEWVRRLRDKYNGDDHARGVTVRYAARIARELAEELKKSKAAENGGGK